MIGVICLAAGYYIAVTTDNPVAAIAMFFIAVVLVIVGAICAVVFSQVQLTELTDEINTANESLSQEKSIAIQLEMQAASKLNTEEIEQIAREKLGMEKVADGQTSYISLTQDDEGTVVQAEKTPNLLDRIWQVLQSLFS